MARPFFPEPTGNPAFDFRAGFRRVSGAVQRWLILLGLACVLLGGGARLLATPEGGLYGAAGWELLAGVALVAAGLAWGYLWREALRRGFRRKYGLGEPRA